MANCEKCIVRELNSLNTLNDDELNEISMHKTTLSFKKGDSLFEEGTHLNGVFCLRNGKCKVTKLSPNGKDQIVRFIKKGELIGQRSIIIGSSAHLTVTALEDMQACFIPKKSIQKHFMENRNFSLDITKSICTDLDNANLTISNMAQKSVKERLADTLLSFNKDFGCDTEGFLKLVLTRVEISNAIGTATESSIRLLSQFKKEGLVELKGKRIKILNKTKLKQIAEGY
ncbi:MAG: Crp/Fnr family transcriptional regulator [Flavobacteriaceae bacterium]